MLTEKGKLPQEVGLCTITYNLLDIVLSLL